MTIESRIVDTIGIIYVNFNEKKRASWVPLCCTLGRENS